jgi:hypothetical protein
MRRRVHGYWLAGNTFAARRGSVSLPSASHLPPDEDANEDDEVVVVVPGSRVLHQGREVTPSPPTVLKNALAAGEEEEKEEEKAYCDATQWGSQDTTSFAAALSAIAGDPTNTSASALTPTGHHGDGLLYDGPDSNPISYGPDSQDEDPPSRFKRSDYRREGVYRRGGGVYRGF